MIVIAERSTKGGGEITPQTFSTVKNWEGVEVSGIKYYVDKAVSLGAIRKRKTKKTEGA
jgi:hypothetical protein